MPTMLDNGSLGNMASWGMPAPGPLNASGIMAGAVQPAFTDFMKSLTPAAPTFQFATPGGADLNWGGSAAPAGMFDSMKSWLGDSGFLGKTENGVTTQGWGGMALGAAQGLGNAWMGMQQYGLAKDQLAQSKKQFDLNFGAQQKTTNAALEDRQAARVASNPGAYQSVADYMKKNGI